MSFVDDSKGTSDRLSIPNNTLVEHAIATAFAEISRFPVKEVFVKPCQINKYIFYGVIFVRNGFFRGGIFKFKICIPADFPNTTALPMVLFEKEIFHPFIAIKTKNLDLSRSFPDGWKKDIHTIRRVIIAVQRSFLSYEDCSNKCSNYEAAVVFKEDRNKFKEMTMENVKDSRASVYDEVVLQNKSSIIKFFPWESSIHEPVRETLTSIGKGEYASRSFLPYRKDTIVEEQGLNFDEIVGKCFPISYSWFSPTKMTITTHLYREQKAHSASFSSSLKDRGKHGIEPLDLSDVHAICKYKILN